MDNQGTKCKKSTFYTRIRSFFDHSRSLTDDILPVRNWPKHIKRVGVLRRSLGRKQSVELKNTLVKFKIFRKNLQRVEVDFFKKVPQI